MGVPYVPVIGLVGTDLLKRRDDMVVAPDPFGEGKLSVVAKAMRPDRLLMIQSSSLPAPRFRWLLAGIPAACRARPHRPERHQFIVLCCDERRDEAQVQKPAPLEGEHHGQYLRPEEEVGLAPRAEVAGEQREYGRHCS